MEERKRDQMSQEAQEAPKYSVCFLDLAEFLGFKDEVTRKMAEHEDEEDDASVTSMQASYYQK